MIFVVSVLVHVFYFIINMSRSKRKIVNNVCFNFFFRSVRVSLSNDLLQFSQFFVQGLMLIAAFFS